MTSTFVLGGGELLHAVMAHTFWFTLWVSFNDDSVWGTCGADQPPTLSAVVLAAEGTEFLGTQHALFAEGIWYPDSSWSSWLVAS